MAFPATERDVAVELYLAGWIDITTDVYVRDGIVISRGRRNEASRAEPSTCRLTLDNRSGNYSPRNPVGAYYGSLGRNTPIRVGVTLAKDTFTRTVSNGWGTADTGQAWSTAGAGGSVLASDFGVASGVGTHSVPLANAYRLTYLPALSLRDVDVAVLVTLPFTDVTGASTEPGNILVRGQSVTDYLHAKVHVTTAEAVTLTLLHYDGTIFAGPVTITGLTHSAAQPLWVRAQVEGETIRAKVWAATGPEPFGWHAVAHTDYLMSPGWVGIRSGVEAGNTNPTPIVFSCDQITIRSPRFCGEVSSWLQRWDLSGNDVYVPIEAAGISRRLRQGRSPLQSTLRRGYTSLAPGALPLAAYWPCEDGAEATSLASGVANQPAMSVLAGTTTLHSHTEFPCSAIPVFRTGAGGVEGPARWIGKVPTTSATGELEIRFLMHVPSSPVQQNGWPIIQLYTQTGLQWEVKYATGGGLEVECWTYPFGSNILDSGGIGFAVDDKNLLVGLSLTQNGGNIDWSLSTLQLGTDLGLNFTGSLIGRTLGYATQVVVDRYGQLDTVAIGHVAVRREVTNIFDLFSEFSAFAGQAAGDRISDLCDLTGIPFTWRGDLEDTQRVGPQRVKAVLDLIDEAADVDMGSLYEARGDVALSYRTRASAYNQTAALALDYALGQVSAPFLPVDDDLFIRNDVTVTRVDGSSARVELTTGRMSVANPELGGAGRYDTAVELLAHTDDQLANLAGWMLLHGTVDEARYPVIAVNLANSAIVAAGIEGAALALDIDDLITVSHPKAGQAPDLISQIVRGYTEIIGPFEHRLELNCTPASPYALLRFGVAGKMKLDSDTSTLASGVSSSATSLSVATTTTRWTTSAGDMPIPISIGGEVMSVAAISGTTSPQTFTVVRSVNGVVKSHSAGAVVALARRATIGL